MSQRAVFLDRDGTVIVNKHYLDTVDGVELLPAAGEGLKAMADLGYRLVLVTNQSGVGRGCLPGSIIASQHRRLQELIAPYGVQFSAMHYCPHAPDDGCRCRKPSPGMLIDAAASLDIDLARSHMIGDSEADIGAGLAAGCHTIHIGTGNACGAHHQAADLVQAADVMKAEQ